MRRNTDAYILRELKAIRSLLQEEIDCMKAWRAEDILQQTDQFERAHQAALDVGRQLRHEAALTRHMLPIEKGA